MSSIDKSNFTIIVSAQEGQEQQVSNKVQGNKWGIKVIVAKEQDKHAAMCAADFGVAFNGEIVSECAACQLPVVTIDNMSLPQAYFTSLYNSWSSDLNVTISGEVYEDLYSTGATPHILHNKMKKHYADPRYRYYYAKRLKDIVFNMVPKVGGEKEVNGKELAIHTNVFTKHGFTENIIAEKILRAVEKY